MRRQAAGLAAGLVAASAAGAVAAVSLTGAAAGPAGQTALPRMSTAEVERTDLAASVLTEGTLGYRPADPVINAHRASPCTGWTICRSC